MQDSRPVVRSTVFWVAANTTSLTVGFWFLDRVMGRVGGAATLLICGAVLGALTGVLQSLTFRLPLKVKATWVALMTLAGMIGLAIGWLTWLQVAYLAGFVPSLMAAGAVIGAFTAIVGFGSFRRSRVSPWLWLAANVAGIAAGLGLGGSMLGWLRLDLSTQGGWLVMGAAGGLIYGAVTATVLTRH